MALASLTIAAATGHEVNMLVPGANLFGNPTRAAACISPDGVTLSWLAPVDGVLNVAPTDAPGCVVEILMRTRIWRSVEWALWEKNPSIRSSQGP